MGYTLVYSFVPTRQALYQLHPQPQSVILVCYILQVPKRSYPLFMEEVREGRNRYKEAAKASLCNQSKFTGASNSHQAYSNCYYDILKSLYSRDSYTKQEFGVSD